MIKVPPKKLLREFGFLTGIGIPLIIGWIIPSFLGHAFRVWTLWVGVPALILGITYPKSLKRPYQFWMLLGHILGWVNSRIILGLIFIFVVQPMALLMKLFGYNPLPKKNPNLSTYRQLRSNQKIDLTRIF